MVTYYYLGKCRLGGGVALGGRGGHLVSLRGVLLLGGGGIIYIRIFLGTLLRPKIRVYKTCVSCNSQQFAQAICVFVAIRSNLHRLFISSCVFVANRCKLPQIATYAGFADPDFRLQQRAQKKIS